MDYSRFYGSSPSAAGLTPEYDPGWAGNGVLPFEAEAAQKAREAAARRMRKNAFMQGQPDQERLDALNASAPEIMPPAVMSAPAIAPADAPASSAPSMQAAGRARRLEETVEKMVAEAKRDREAIAGLQATIAELSARMAPAESPEPASAKASEKARKATAAAN
jgi:hypothetical protein